MGSNPNQTRALYLLKNQITVKWKELKPKPKTCNIEPKPNSKPVSDYFTMTWFDSNLTVQRTRTEQSRNNEGSSHLYYLPCLFKCLLKIHHGNTYTPGDWLSQSSPWLQPWWCRCRRTWVLTRRGDGRPSLDCDHSPTTYSTGCIKNTPHHIPYTW